VSLFVSFPEEPRLKLGAQEPLGLVDVGMIVVVVGEKAEGASNWLVLAKVRPFAVYSVNDRDHCRWMYAVSIAVHIAVREDGGWLQQDEALV
jgi:hypothetical protein